jgi:hypothetical protein
MSLRPPTAGTVLVALAAVIAAALAAAFTVNQLAARGLI